LELVRKKFSKLFFSKLFTKIVTHNSTLLNFYFVPKEYHQDRSTHCPVSVDLTVVKNEWRKHLEEVGDQNTRKTVLRLFIGEY